MKGIVLRRNEVLAMNRTPVGGTFRVLRALGPTWRDNIGCPENERPAMIAAMLRVGPYQPGKVYAVKENFVISYRPDRNQTWITFKADGQIAAGGPVHGKTGYVDGEYSPVLMKDYMARCWVTIQRVEVVFDWIDPQPAFSYMKAKQLWAWAIHLQRKVRWAISVQSCLVSRSQSVPP